MVFYFALASISLLALACSAFSTTPATTCSITVTAFFLPSVQNRKSLQPATRHCPRQKPRTSRSLLSSRHNEHPFVEDVQVFDNVFSEEACEELGFLARDHAERGVDGSSIFYLDDNLLTPLEQALKSFIQELSPESIKLHSSEDKIVVEYWSRDEYINIDAHADIDEQLLEDDGLLKCPDFGHILYLDIDPSIRGPTCVFSKCKGWENQTPNDDNSNSLPTVSLVTVPAVPGRVLRFPGSALHAVPKPPTVWFLTPEQQEKLKAEEERIPDMDDVEQWEEEDDEESVIERSVILFNIWKTRGPRGVTQDFSKGALPEGIGIVDEDDDDDDSSYMEQAKTRLISEWEEDYGKGCSELWCQPRAKWQQVDIHENGNKISMDDEPTSENTKDIGKLSISLMGKQTRRLYPKKFVDITVDATAKENLLKALEDKLQP